MLIGYILILSAALSFGLYPAAAKLAYADGMNATSLVLITTAARTFTLVGAAWLRGINFHQITAEMRDSMWGGACQAATIFGIIFSLRYIPGPVMITIVFTHTLILLAILHVRGEGAMSTHALVSSIAALLGIMLVVNLFGNAGELKWLGIALAFLGAVTSAIRVYTYGKQVRDTAPELVGARAFLIALIFLLPLLLFETPTAPHKASGAVGVLLACLSLSVGTLCTFRALKILGSFRCSLTLKFEPVVTCLFSWWILDERLSPSQYLGIGIVLGSLVFYQIVDATKRTVLKPLETQA
jgi:drug/metabolite transporter (DMT)-like permease